jgi:hypothetical protein
MRAGQRRARRPCARCLQPLPGGTQGQQVIGQHSIDSGVVSHRYRCSWIGIAPAQTIGT